jgi:hypothetical protein
MALTFKPNVMKIFTIDLWSLRGPASAGQQSFHRELEPDDGQCCTGAMLDQGW